MTLQDQQGRTQTATTGTFGYFRFTNIAAGEIVVVSVISKRYSFQPQIISITDNIDDLIFWADSSTELQQ